MPKKNNKKDNNKKKWDCATPILTPRPEGFVLVLSDVWLNAKGAAEKLKISLRKFNGWKQKNVFAFRNEGGTFSYNEAELDDLILRMYNGTATNKPAE